MLARIVLPILIALGFGFLTQPLQAQAVLDTVCAGARGVSYRVNEVNGASFLWKIQGGVIADGNGSNEILVDWGKDTGLYPIEVVQYSAQGCPGEPVRAFVWVRGGIDVDILGPKEICEGEELTLKASGGKFYSWQGFSGGSELKIRPDSTTEYTVIGYSEFCGMDTASFVVQVNKRPKANILVNSGDPKLNDWIMFVNDGTSDNTEAKWRFEGSTGIEKGQNVQWRYTKAGNYSVSLVVIDPSGCSDSAGIIFTIKANPQVFVPNAFSPNGDGLNDIFEPVTSDINHVKLQVFNRWGEMMYTGENYYAKWDGTFKGEIVAEGVYVYYVEAIGLDGKLYTYNGTLTVIK